jgi:hypothetical protein
MFLKDPMSLSQINITSISFNGIFLNIKQFLCEIKILSKTAKSTYQIKNNKRIVQLIG